MSGEKPKVAVEVSAADRSDVQGVLITRAEIELILERSADEAQALAPSLRSVFDLGESCTSLRLR